MIKRIAKVSFFLFLVSFAYGQQVQITPSADQIKIYTPDWKGERLSDGRPQVAAR